MLYQHDIFLFDKLSKATRPSKKTKKSAIFKLPEIMAIIEVQKKIQPIRFYESEDIDLYSNKTLYN